MGVRINKYKLELVKESAMVYEVESASSPRNASVVFEKIFNLSKQAEEVLALLVLDTKCKVVGAFEVSRGSIDSSILSPREIFKRALLLNGYGIMVAHNHPSGNSKPSQEDIKVTKRLKECSDILGIKLLDHIVTGYEEYTSFSEEGLL